MDTSATEISPEDREALIRDKYNGNREVDISDDLKRLFEGEPLAYVIGWIPFLGLKIHLDSHPLIPRPETEWWTELLIEHLRELYPSEPFSLLDLCAGSGAIGLSVLKHLPNADVTFGEIVPLHSALIEKNLVENKLDASRTHVLTGNLFEPVSNQRFTVIAANPPYIPKSRFLDSSVKDFEPSLGLFAGKDGMKIISKIAVEAQSHLLPGGELWMECDIDNVEDAKKEVTAGGALRAEILTDLYGRPRLVVGYFP